MQITLTIKEGEIGPYGQFELLSGGQDFEQTLPPRMCLEIATELGRILVGIHDSPGAKRIRRHACGTLRPMVSLLPATKKRPMPRDHPSLVVLLDGARCRTMPKRSAPSSKLHGGHRQGDALTSAAAVNTYTP